jgi:hypothetical protein
MDILLHAGAHPTDNDTLMVSMKNNIPALDRCHVAVPDPVLYRRSLRQAMRQIEGEQFTDELRDMLYDSICGAQPPDTQAMVLSVPMLFAPPAQSVGQGVFFPQAVEKLRSAVEVFKNDRIKLFFAIRNPATYLAAPMKTCDSDNLSVVTGNSAPETLRWSELFLRLQAHFLDMKITLCCYEDSPFIWQDVIRAVGQASPNIAIKDTYRLYLRLLSDVGQARFVAYMNKNTNLSAEKKREVMFAFAEKFGRPEIMDQDVSITGLAQEEVDFLTDLYEDDLAKIVEIPNVRLIFP